MFFLNFQAEAHGVKLVNNSILGTNSHKRVRFERKAIERDLDLANHTSNFAPNNSSSDRERLKQTPHSLHRNSADRVPLLCRPSIPTLESGMDKFSHQGSSQMDNRHVTGASLLPWSRVYKMTQFTEAIPSSPQPKVYGSYTPSDTNDRNRLPSEKYSVRESQNYVVIFPML